MNNSFIETSSPKSPKPFHKKRGWKFFCIVFGVILIVGISFAAYVVATGSKVFENGLGSGTALLKTLTGQKKTLKGEDRDRINIMVIGMGGINHPGGMLADSIMFMSFKPSTKQLALLSIPRDLKVPIDGHGENKINSTFAAGYNDYVAKNCNRKNESTCTTQALSAGAALTDETVSEVLGQPIDYYVSADFSGFEKIIDQLGGIDVYVDKAIYDPYFPDKAMRGYEPFKISAGLHHMDGELALKYARSRHTTSDFDRAKRQQTILEAVKAKALKTDYLANPKNILDLLSTLGSSFKTNFSPSELKTFIDEVKDISSDKIINEVLTSGPDGQLSDLNNGTYYLVPKTGNFNVIQTLTRNIFSQNDPAENAKIEILNGSRTAGLGSKLASELEDAGYNVVSIANADKKYSTSSISDYTNGKDKNTLAFIKEKLNVAIASKSRVTLSIDISILIGDDYAKVITNSNGISSQSNS